MFLTFSFLLVNLNLNLSLCSSWSLSCVQVLRYVDGEATKCIRGDMARGLGVQ